MVVLFSGRLSLVLRRAGCLLSDLSVDSAGFISADKEKHYACYSVECSRPGQYEWEIIFSSHFFHFKNTWKLEKWTSFIVTIRNIQHPFPLYSALLFPACYMKKVFKNETMMVKLYIFIYIHFYTFYTFLKSSLSYILKRHEMTRNMEYKVVWVIWTVNTDNSVFQELLLSIASISTVTVYFGWTDIFNKLDILI